MAELCFHKLVDHVTTGYIYTLPANCIALVGGPQRGPSTTQFCRIKGCGGAGCPPPPIIFERLKLPQQIIYRRKENLSESPNHLKYRKNILISRFYELFCEIVGLRPFLEVRKNFTLGISRFGQAQNILAD